MENDGRAPFELLSFNWEEGLGNLWWSKMPNARDRASLVGSYSYDVAGTVDSAVPSSGFYYWNSDPILVDQYGRPIISGSEALSSHVLPIFWGESAYQSKSRATNLAAELKDQVIDVAEVPSVTGTSENLSQALETPRIGETVLAYLYSSERQEAELGDLEELFQKRAAKYGAKSARRWYYFQVFRSVLAAALQAFKEFALIHDLWRKLF